MAAAFGYLFFIILGTASAAIVTLVLSLFVALFCIRDSVEKIAGNDLKGNVQVMRATTNAFSLAHRSKIKRR